MTLCTIPDTSLAKTIVHREVFTKLSKSWGLKDSDEKIPFIDGYLASIDLSSISEPGEHGLLTYLRLFIMGKVDGTVTTTVLHLPCLDDGKRKCYAARSVLPKIWVAFKDLKLPIPQCHLRFEPCVGTIKGSPALFTNVRPLIRSGDEYLVGGGQYGYTYKKPGYIEFDAVPRGLYLLQSCIENSYLPGECLSQIKSLTQSPVTS